MKLRTRIKELRNSINLNQTELATKLNVSKQTVSNWENGNRVPDAQTLIKLADIFDVTTDFLLGRTDKKDSALYSFNIEGDNVIFEVSKEIYPNGLSRTEVLDKLKILKQLEDLGIILPSEKND